MQPGLLPIVAMVVVIFLPGWLAFRIAVPWGRVLTGLALAPALSAGVVFLAGIFADLIGLRFGPPLWGVGAALLALVAVWRWRQAMPRRSRSGSVPTPKGVLLMLIGGTALSASSVLVGMSGEAVVPPNRDAANHGVMAARVSDLETLDVHDVLRADVPGDGNQAAFYPLALHGQIAVAHRSLGVGIAEALLAATVVFSGLVLPLTVFAFARALLPDLPRVAGFAALSLPAVGFFPLIPLRWGSVTLIAGLAMAPAVIWLVVRYLASGGVAMLALTVVAMVGILGTHASEVPLVVLGVAVALLPAVLHTRDLVRLRDALGRALQLGLLLVIALLPVLDALGGGTAERATIDLGILSAAEALNGMGRFLSAGGGIGLPLGVLAAGGVVVAWKRRATPVIAFLAALLGLYLVAGLATGPWRALTLPWYHHPTRVALNLVILLPVLAGLMLDRLRLGRWVVPGVALSLAVVGAHMQAHVISLVFAQEAMVDEDAVAAFEYLAARADPGARVLVDQRNAKWDDGATWMYPFAGVSPLFTLEPSKPSASWSEREWLVQNLPQLGTDPRVEALLDKYGVRYAYVDTKIHDERALAFAPIDISKLRAVGACERFRRGSSLVFEIDPRADCR